MATHIDIIMFVSNVSDMHWTLAALSINPSKYSLLRVLWSIMGIHSATGCLLCYLAIQSTKSYSLDANFKIVKEEVC